MSGHAGSSSHPQSASALFTQGVAHERAQAFADARDAYAAAAQRFLDAARAPAASVAAREEAKRGAKRALERALECKKRSGERGALEEAEQTRVLAASTLINGHRYPLWPAASASLPPPSLSAAQRALGASFGKPRVRAPATVIVADAQQKLKGREIRQDVVTDCSVVAALEAAAEHDARWGTQIAYSALFPQDASGTPLTPEDGQHRVRMYINGAARGISIDDALPLYPTGLPMCARAVSERGLQLWPSLLEKAYLRLQASGYDFRGSNSAADLYALSGWLPEHIGLSHAGFQREKTWTRVWNAWQRGEVIITAGTGKESRGDGVQPLVRSHDYAVLEMKEERGERSLVLLNPWSRRGAARREEMDAATSDTADAAASQNGDTSVQADMQASLARLALDSSFEEPALELESEPELIELSWTEACNRLDALYLNWQPSLFSHSLAAHIRLRAAHSTRAENGTPASANDVQRSVGQNPQYCLTVEGREDGDHEEVWVHLARHLDAQPKRDDEETEYVALHVYENAGERRVYEGRVDGKQGTYTDSAHHLLRLRAGRQKRNYTLVVSRHGPACDAAFTLTAHGHAPLQLHELPRAYPHETRVEGAWRGRSAGGNSTHATFVHNPQYRLVVPASAATSGARSTATSLLLLLEAPRDVAVCVLLVHGNGARCASVQANEVLASSGAFRYGLAVLEATLPAHGGAYSVVVCTYAPAQQGAFVLTLQASTPSARIETLPAEGAGMYSRVLRGAWRRSEDTAAGAPGHGSYGANPRFRLTVSAPMARFALRLSLPELEGANAARPALNVAIFASTSANRALGREIISSGPYAEGVCGVSIAEARLERGSYDVVCSTWERDVEGTFVLDVYSDRAVDCKRVQ